MVGGASAVSQDIPPFCLAEGNKSFKRIKSTGLRRRFDNREDIDAIKHAYRELFESGKPLQEVANELFENNENKHVKVSEFCIKYKRGIPLIEK